MTATTRPSTDLAPHPTLRDLARRWASGVFTVARRLRTIVSEVSDAGQLGRDSETEIGRWTGARV